MNGECCCEGLLSINLQGKICVFNSVAAEILEMQREAVLNQPFALHFFDYAENDEFNQIILNFFLQQYAGDMFVVPYFTGQSRKLLFLKCSLVYSQETEIPEKVGMLAAFRDVSHIAEIRNVIKTTADWKMQTGSENIALSEQIPGQVPLVSLKSVSMIGAGDDVRRRIRA